jgi:hypothetical protein
VARLLRDDWEQELRREGLAPVEPQIATQPGAVTCPACGNSEPLVDGACSDCGLVLG